MKIIKKFKILMTFIILQIFAACIPVYAAGTATVSFEGNSTVKVGSSISVKMYIKNISNVPGGVFGIQGILDFDSTYLEYVSGTASSSLSPSINSTNYKIIGMTISESTAINNDTLLFTFTFKAKKTGTTSVTLKSGAVSDGNSDAVSLTINKKTITITEETQTDPTPSVPTTKSSDATLKSLSVSGYTLSPSFSANTTSYTVSVPNNATIAKIEGSTNDTKANVTGLGNITLKDGTTTATVKVTAEDGTTKTYTINFVKKEEEKKDSDATLKSLSVSGYTLSPTFKNNINTYSMKVQNSITGLNVTAIPSSDKATVTVSGNKNWKEGVNVVTIKVTAEDGSVNTYTVNVTRESSNTNSTTTTKSSDNYLKSLIINSSHEIIPKFDKDISNYEINVPYEVEKLDLSYVTNNGKANVEVTGNENFKAGEVNTVQITVTAEDGTKRVYTLNVTRTTSNSDNNLKELIVKDGELSPKFDPDILEYSIKVDGDTTELDITAIAENSESKVEIIGNKNLKEGHNTVLVKVSDKNGFIKYYTIDVEKAVKETKVLGLSPLQFGISAGILGFLILLILILFILLIILLKRRKKDKNEIKNENENKSVAPIIEVKPEFNFGSKNTSDDDVVHGNSNQNSHVLSEPTNSSIDAVEADYEEKIPYDPYDYTVTKREIVDAIYEATKTKDTAKLKMLLEQDALNQRKKEIKRREEEKAKEESKENWR
ncbi:MAG: cadherin-like beta sandwich domain-containing protein [Bacilli bacterium]|nr:cadherin-like beta sandwich domain-containing protein [Bacilli bacterium]